MDTDTDYVINHRIFYVAVGKSSRTVAKNIVAEFKITVEEADAARGIPSHTFLDLFFPEWGDKSRVETMRICVPHNQLGKLSSSEDVG